MSQAELGTCCCSNLELSIPFSKDNLLHPLCPVRALGESPVSAKTTDTVSHACTQMELQVCRAVGDCCLSTDVHTRTFRGRWNSPSVNMTLASGFNYKTVFLYFTAGSSGHCDSQSALLLPQVLSNYSGQLNIWTQGAIEQQSSSSSALFLSFFFFFFACLSLFFTPFLNLIFSFSHSLPSPLSLDFSLPPSLGFIWKNIPGVLLGSSETWFLFSVP